jgi:hypothetical protein
VIRIHAVVSVITLSLSDRRNNAVYLTNDAKLINCDTLAPVYFDPTSHSRGHASLEEDISEQRSAYPVVHETCAHLFPPN